MSESPWVAVRWQEDALGGQTATFKERDWVVDVRVAAQILDRNAEAYGFHVTMTEPSLGRRLAHVGSAPTLEAAKEAALESASKRIDVERRRARG